MPYRKLFLSLLLLTSLHMTAQMNYPIFKYGDKIQASDSQRLSFHLYNLNYFHNTEWFTNIPLSGTLFGYQLIPKLRYQPSPRLSITAGLYVQKEFGRNEYTTVAPTFTVKYQARKSAFIFGTLEGGINHGFIEPIYDYKWLINERLENGFQILTKTKYYEHDLYINWRKAIHFGDKFKEEFDVGYVADFNVMKKEFLNIQVPLQFIYSHKGGQIDSSDAPVQSLFNWTTGLKLDIPINHSLLKKIELDNYYVNYKDISGAKRQPYDRGVGYLSRLAFDLSPFVLDLRYWFGNQYIGPRGMALFQSVSEKYPGLTEDKREILIVSLIFDKEIYKNIFFDLRFIPYTDFREKMTSGTGWEYSYEMYLKFVLNTGLGHLGKEQN